MIFLALDVGSSSVKAQLFADGAGVGVPVRVGYPTIHDGVKAEVDPAAILTAVKQAIASLGPQAATAQTIGLAVMSPAWVAMDANGRALTPIVIHQDRRSVQVARDLENRVGKERHLALAGNRPFPGGISSTTCAWFLAHEPQTMRQADLVGHLNTFLQRQLTGRRVIDPSSASFTGLYLTCDQGGWSDELCQAVGISKSLLPEVMESDQIGGTVTEEAAREFGLCPGAAVLAGMVDTSAAIILTGANDGQIFNTCGSTDVLAVCCDRAIPHEQLLTRALGIGKKWVSVGTLAATGSALDWMHREIFSDFSRDQFHKLTAELAAGGEKSSVQFEPYLAGERTSIEQRQASFSGLTLSATRRQMLAAAIDALAVASAKRLQLLAQVQPRFLPDVFISGGGEAIATVMHRDWPGTFRFKYMPDATLAGLASLGAGRAK
ncbi:MAG: FGGY family carbohydrate kinase [Tepidisphaeraceae bacterium]